VLTKGPVFVLRFHEGRHTESPFKIERGESSEWKYHCRCLFSLAFVAI